ncbi:hypothetical protein U1Q18_015080 [Sarracenia purpurea var. burkii]
MDEDRSHIGGIKKAIKAELALFSSSTCSHIRRRGNMVAHELASLATSIGESRKWYSDIYPPLRHLVATEASPSIITTVLKYIQELGMRGLSPDGWDALHPKESYATIPMVYCSSSSAAYSPYARCHTVSFVHMFAAYSPYACCLQTPQTPSCSRGFSKSCARGDSAHMAVSATVSPIEVSPIVLLRGMAAPIFPGPLLHMYLEEASPMSIGNLVRDPEYSGSV